MFSLRVAAKIYKVRIGVAPDPVAGWDGGVLVSRGREFINRATPTVPIESSRGRSQYDI